MSQQVNVYRKLNVGFSDSPILLDTYAIRAVELYTTCASTNTTNSTKAVVFNSTMTGVAGVGRCMEVNLDTNVALGTWANALKANVTCNTSGKATGLLSVICAEMTMPTTGTGAGTRAIYEAEVTCPATWTDTMFTSIFYIGTSGATKTNFDTTGLLFEINGVATTSAGFFYLADLTVSKADGLLRCRINGTIYYMFITTAINGG